MSPDSWTKEKATKWFNAKDWANGLNPAPHESTDIPEFSLQYTKNKAYRDKAFACLRETNLDKVAPGKYHPLLIYSSTVILLDQDGVIEPFS